MLLIALGAVHELFPEKKLITQSFPTFAIATSAVEPKV
jgi:hypothetical protein